MGVGKRMGGEPALRRGNSLMRGWLQMQDSLEVWYKEDRMFPYGSIKLYSEIGDKTMSKSGSRQSMVEPVVLN